MSMLGKILKVPMYLLVIGSFVASIYAAAKNLQGVTYATPIVIAIIIILYIIGDVSDRKKHHSTIHTSGM